MPSNGQRLYRVEKAQERLKVHGDELTVLLIVQSNFNSTGGVDEVKY